MSGNRVVSLGRPAVAKIYASRWRQHTETGALRLVRPQRVAPRLLAAGTLRGRPVSLMTRVGGGPGDGGASVREAVDLLHRVHRVPVADRPAGRISAPGTSPSWPAYLESRILAYRDVFAQRGLREPATACATVSDLLNRLPDRPSALLHNDPNPSNFVGRGPRLRLVDWELAVAGDPLLDLVRLCWEWQVPADAWLELTGRDYDHPHVRAYRAVHGLSRLMAAVCAPSTGRSALGERCARELSVLGHLPRLYVLPPPTTTRTDRTARGGAPSPTRSRGDHLSSHTSHPLQYLLRHTVPGAVLEDEPVPTRKGLSNEGWRLATDHGTFMVKLNDAPGAAQEHFARAADASRLLRERGLAVPQVFAYGSTDTLEWPTADAEPRAYLVQEWLDGQDAEDYLRTASKPQADQLFHRLGALVGAVHDIPFACGIEPAHAADVGALYRAKLATLLERNRACGILPEDELALVGDLVTRMHALRETSTSARMTHHDLHLPNVLVRPDASVALIDLDFMRPGDPVEDFVKLELWAFGEPAHRSSFLAGYREGHTGPCPPDAELRLHTYQILNALSYVDFFSLRDPKEADEWTKTLRQLCDGARERISVTRDGGRA
ncbi:hypothetical protein GCM10022384_63970 [Streptomyces marokkonensis]|uniref:Aminoglycoside phosphotransferase domain-containing protein n=1 Tax=Streptomyces marokkonensis TaxID=324855 RepID=A0ABP7SCH0_9ACTN